MERMEPKVLLMGTIYPRKIEILENDDNIVENELIFQNYGALLHYTFAVQQYLDERISGEWMSRRGSIDWPPRSPYLTPQNFYLYGH